jgi:hypothetical protein
VQLVVEVPQSTGGLPISSYLVEWCADASFSDRKTYGNSTITSAGLLFLDGSTQSLIVFTVSGLNNRVVGRFQNLANPLSKKVLIVSQQNSCHD